MHPRVCRQLTQGAERVPGGDPESRAGTISPPRLALGAELCSGGSTERQSRGAEPLREEPVGAEPQYRRQLHGGRGPACGGRSLRGGASVSEAAPRWAGPCLWWAELRGDFNASFLCEAHSAV